MTLAVSLVASGAIAIAEDKVPTVYVDKSEIMFEDQTPVILGEGFTVVPARGVFEAMDATVEWDAAERKVDVTSADNNTLIRMFIDNNTMTVYDMTDMFNTLLSGQDFKAPEKSVTLEVAPQIIGDRTMIPLRAISEALDANVDWNGADYTIDITTGRTAPAGAPEFSLSADKLTANEGETVDLYINVKNLPEGKFVSGVSAAVNYDPTCFEFVEAALVNGSNAVEGALGAANAEFGNGVVKAAAVTVDAKSAVTADGAVMKFTFKSVNGKEGAFSISNAYNTKVGYNSSLLLDTEAEGSAIEYDGIDLVVSTDTVVINAEGVAPTATPEATVDPTATAEPTADPTAIPDVILDPSVTDEPTASPEATAEPTAEPTATPAA